MSPNNHSILPNMQPAVDHERGAANRVAIAIGAGALVVAVAGVGMLPFFNKGKSPVQPGDKPVAGAANYSTKYCAELTLDNAAADPLKFHPDAGLPIPEKPIKSEVDVAPYVASLFGKNGPLSGRGDGVSLALVEALIDVPAHNGKAFDPRANVIDEFDKKMSAYSAPTTGLQAAAADCVQLVDTLRQTASYSVTFAHATDKLIKYRVDRGPEFKAIGITATNFAAVGDMTAIKYTLPDTSKGLDGFGEVYESTTPGSEGDLFVRGSVIAPQTSKNLLNQNGQKLTPAEKSKVLATLKAAAGGKATSKTGGSTGGTNGNTGKTGTAVGSVPENKHGPAGGTTSGSGATPEASTGTTHNTPGGGGTASPTPTPGNTPPVVVVVPSKSPTPQPTNTYVPPTASPTPSPTPKGTEPPCVSNPPYVIC